MAGALGIRSGGASAPVGAAGAAPRDEEQIRLERLPEREREWHRQYQERQREIQREARRRLGLPEEEPHR